MDLFTLFLIHAILCNAPITMCPLRGGGWLLSIEREVCKMKVADFQNMLFNSVRRAKRITCGFKLQLVQFGIIHPDKNSNIKNKI